MKIAILGIKTLPATAGADRVVEKYLENIGDENEYFIYLSKIDNKEKLNCTEKYLYIYIPSFKSKYFKAFCFFFLSSIHFLVKGDCDIAHIHNSDFGLFNILIWLKRKTKILGTFHGNPYQRDKWNLFGKIYLKVSEFFFLSFSDALTTVAKSKLNEVPKRYLNKITYIPNGIEVINNKENNTKLDYSKFKIVSNKYIFFACGRLDRTKGLSHLINAYNELDIEEKLLVVGDFGHDTEYSQKIHELASKNSNIILHKSLLRKDELFQILENCRLFVFPSEIEAMSMMLLEAISCKALIVCSDIIENIDVVGKDYPYTFRNKDYKDLKLKIELALHDNNTKGTIDPLFDNVSQKFNWRSIANKYESLYTQLKTGNEIQISKEEIL